MATFAPAASDVLPSVSVIVPCYRLSDRAGRLVEALRRQDYPIEIVLVDDGSDDDTAVRLRTLLAGTPNATVIEHGENRGRAAARNTGIEAASGDVLLFLDADMSPPPGFARAHAVAHTRGGVVGVLSTPRLRGLDPGNVYHRYLQWRREETVRGDDRVPFHEFIIGYTSVNAEAVRSVGGFDERISYGEDIDFAYRLAQVPGTRMIRSSRAQVDHYEHGGLDERLEKLRVFGSQSLPYLIDKHPGLAERANLDFVRPTTPKAWSRWIALRAFRPSWLRRAIPRIPEPLRLVAVRYLMAATVASAFREARTEGPNS